jgi:hypothetical protein
MKYPIELNRLLSSESGDVPRQLESFAIFSLGVIESLMNGSIKPDESVPFFFHAANCSYIRRLKNKLADAVMGRGVQLADLFDVMPPDEAQREFQRELEAMRGLCVRLLKKRKLVA